MDLSVDLTYRNVNCLLLRPCTFCRVTANLCLEYRGRVTVSRRELNKLLSELGGILNNQWDRNKNLYSDTSITFV